MVTLSRDRYISRQIIQDLKDKVVFIAGPRQVGKTTLALHLLAPGSDESHPAYLNWDDDQDRQRILNRDLPSDEPLLIFDEIHKFANWRNFIKGLYDKEKSKRRFIVTGSARLDYYSKGGDSLDGRYFMYRLHPFTCTEISGDEMNGAKRLLEYGGFPEPLSRADDIFLKRWHRSRMHHILTDDLRDLEQVKEISRIELLATYLPSLVGSPLSIESLKNNLQVAHQSVARWLQILENLYVCFRIPPFGAAMIRAVKKEQKLYFWDWSMVPNEGGFRFENMLACHLLKYVHYREDVFGDEMSLRYLRDTDGREVDFVVLKNRQAEFAVECKVKPGTISKHIAYFKERTTIPRFYQVHLGDQDEGDAETTGRSLPFIRFCRELGLP